MVKQYGRGYGSVQRLGLSSSGNAHQGCASLQHSGSNTVRLTTNDQCIRIKRNIFLQGSTLQCGSSDAQAAVQRFELPDRHLQVRIPYPYPKQ